GARAAPLHAGRTRGVADRVRDAADVLAVILPGDGAARAVVDAGARTGRIDERPDRARCRVAGVAGRTAGLVLSAAAPTTAVVAALPVLRPAMRTGVPVRAVPLSVIPLVVRLGGRDARSDQHDRRADRHRHSRPSRRHRLVLLRHAPRARTRRAP